MEQVVHDRSVRDAIAKAAEAVDRVSLASWTGIDDLAPRVDVDKISVDPESIVMGQSGGRFEGLLNLYLTLNFEPEGPEPFSSNESFWGTFKGHLENDNPVVDSVQVNTAGLYS